MLTHNVAIITKRFRGSIEAALRHTAAGWLRSCQHVRATMARMLRVLRCSYALLSKYFRHAKAKRRALRRRCRHSCLLMLCSACRRALF